MEIIINVLLGIVLTAGFLIWGVPKLTSFLGRSEETPEPQAETRGLKVSAEWIRPSTIAGSWYPGNPKELTEMVDGFLEQVKPVYGEPIALIVPHAGYEFSGLVAASGFKQLEGVDYDVAIIIASDHRPPLSNPISVWAKGGFETPLGVVPVNEELAREIIETDPLISFAPETHQNEHPIEIELPFLQRVSPNCSIVPILMGSDDDNTVSVLSEALVSVLSKKRGIVIASSDLSHYPASSDARHVDQETLSAIETGDPTKLRETTEKLMGMGFSNLDTCVCGRGPIMVAMRVAEGLGANTISILRYMNSGDILHGSDDKVVGYGAVMFWRYAPPELTREQQRILLDLAYKAIEEYLRTNKVPAYTTEDPVMNQNSGIFLTLRIGVMLRGCIGQLWSEDPLYKVVQDTAISAATRDPRFPPLTIKELEDITIKISILSPLRRITEIEEIEVGTHGLVIVHEGQRGVLLPQVPVERGWDRITFLENLCLKAGLPGYSWKENPTLYVFTTIEF